jgi:hypothetical protein
MAENWDNLKRIRLKLRDPAGVIALQNVATAADLPASPARQTAYRANDTGTYSVYDANLKAWQAIDLLLSDETINDALAACSEDAAIRQLIPMIIASLFEQLKVVSIGTGTESTSYASITAAIDFYERLKTQYAAAAAEAGNSSTGRIFRARRPVIGGVVED